MPDRAQREFPIVYRAGERANQPATSDTAASTAHGRIEAEQRMESTPVPRTTSSSTISTNVTAAAPARPAIHRDPSSTGGTSTLDSLLMPPSPRLGPVGTSSTVISSFTGIGSPASERSEPGQASLSLESRRQAEQAALDFARTRRFEWTAVEKDGKIVDYIVNGHSGELQRCEDEAIGSPGAVQSFGVLIAFDQEADGRLVVQQVSENSGSILGLDPHTLLSSPSLTPFLPEAAIHEILEHLDLLNEWSDPTCEPIAFLLEGFKFSAYAVLHRPSPATQPKRAILELELVDDQIYPCTPAPSLAVPLSKTRHFKSHAGLGRLHTWRNWEERMKKPTLSGQKRELDVLKVASEAQRQLSIQSSLEPFLKLVAEIFHEITGFARIMIYRFDEKHNGEVVEEIIGAGQSKESYLGLTWPASDIPSQARDLYKLNKIRFLYDADQTTSRMCCRDIEEANTPLDMSHCYLRALSPLHIFYLKQMQVKSSMSVSLVVDDQLWGLIAFHDFGPQARRVSPPLRQLCTLIGQSASTHLERILLKERVEGRYFAKQPGEGPPSPGELLDVFDAYCAALCVGSCVRLIGTVEDSQEILAIVKWLQHVDFNIVLHTHEISKDYPNIPGPGGGFKDVVAFLAIPLKANGDDMMVFFRRAEEKEVHWAGNPNAESPTGRLQPRASFELWRERVTGQSRPWTLDQLQACGLVGLIYGKFASIWKEKRQQDSPRHRNLLRQNAGHATRTPLNAILNHLEVALEEAPPAESRLRESLASSASATRSLINVVNDLLELTHAGDTPHEEFFLGEPINLSALIEEASSTWRVEARRKGIELILRPRTTPPMPRRIISDPSYIRKIITSLVGNATENTEQGSILVEWGMVVQEPSDDPETVAKSEPDFFISVTDTGVGISQEELEVIFRDLENVTSIGDPTARSSSVAVGLGIAITSRIVGKLGGQLRIDSTPGSGTCVHLTLPLHEAGEDEQDISVRVSTEARQDKEQGTTGLGFRSIGQQQQQQSVPRPDEPPHTAQFPSTSAAGPAQPRTIRRRPVLNPLQSAHMYIPPVMPPSAPLEVPSSYVRQWREAGPTHSRHQSSPVPSVPRYPDSERIGLTLQPLKIIVVEDDPISRQILSRRLERDGNTVVTCEHGGLCLEILDKDPEQDLILLDLQMPIKDGPSTAQEIRRREEMAPVSHRQPAQLNGRLPILAVSAQIDLVGESKLIECGFDGIVSKPVDFDRLRSMLAGVLDLNCRKDMYWRAPSRPTRGGSWFPDSPPLR